MIFKKPIKTIAWDKFSEILSLCTKQNLQEKFRPQDKSALSFSSRSCFGSTSDGA